MAEVDLETLRLRIKGLSEGKKGARQMLRVAEWMEKRGATGKGAGEMRRVAEWMQKRAKRMLREVLERDDLDRVSRRIEQIRGEELTIAWNEMGVTDVKPDELHDDEEHDACSETARSKSAGNGARCNRPIETVVMHGDNVGSLCAGHRSAYERVGERVLAAFGDGVWDAVPDDWSFDLAD